MIKDIKAELTELSKLAVGDDQGSESSETFKSFIAVLLSSALVNWGAWERCSSTTNVLCLPNELLEKVSIILGQQQQLGLFNDLADILNQLLALLGKLA
jgi:hypothetical protein